MRKTNRLYFLHVLIKTKRANLTTLNFPLASRSLEDSMLMSNKKFEKKIAK